VAAQRAAGGGGQFEIDAGACGQRAERGFVERLLGQIRMEVGGIDVKRVRQTPETPRESPSRRRAAIPGASTVMRRTHHGQQD